MYIHIKMYEIGFTDGHCNLLGARMLMCSFSKKVHVRNVSVPERV